MSQDVIPILQKSGLVFFQKSAQILQEQTNTIGIINRDIEFQYQKLEPLIDEIQQKNQSNLEALAEVEAFASHLDGISEMIDKMEENEWVMVKKVEKIEQKFSELKKIQNLITKISDK